MKEKHEIIKGSSHRRCLKKRFLKISQNSLEKTSGGVSISKKETPTQMFACKFCENFKTTFFTEHLRWLLLDKQGD